MSTITIEEREMMVKLANDFIMRMKNFDQEFKYLNFEFNVFPDNIPVFVIPIVNSHFKAFLNGRNTLVSIYNSLEKTIQIQKKEIEDLQKQLELQKEKSTTVNDASLLIAMSNIYEKARRDYFDDSDRLRRNGSSMKKSFSEYLAKYFIDVSDAVKIYKEKTNA